MGLSISARQRGRNVCFGQELQSVKSSRQSAPGFNAIFIVNVAVSVMHIISSLFLLASKPVSSGDLGSKV